MTPRPALLLLALLSLTAEPAGALSLTVTLSFEGGTFATSRFIPPDSMGAVGPHHVVELLNGRYAVYRKGDGGELETDSLDGFWEAAGIDPDSFSFDPRVVYDPASERFFAVSVDNNRQANRLLVAVSSSADPTEGWTGFAVDSDAADETWADFPTLGFDDEGVYVSAAMCPLGGGDLPTGHDVLVIPKADLVAPILSIDDATLFERAPLPTVGFNAQPVIDADGTGLPTRLYSGTLAFLGQIQTSVIGGTITEPTLEAGGLVPAPAFFEPPPAEQPGDVVPLDSGDSRFSSAPVQQGGSVWLVQNVAGEGRAALRWLEIDAETNILLQSGLISDPELDLIYPSIAVNELDEVVIGFSGSGEDQFASAYAVLGVTRDGVTRFGTPLLLAEGRADYQRLDGSGRNRFGDYSATLVDPDDPRSFWTFQEFVPATNRWSVQITRLLVPEPSTGLLVALGLLVLRRHGGRVP